MCASERGARQDIKAEKQKKAPPPKKRQKTIKTCAVPLRVLPRVAGQKKNVLKDKEEKTAG